MDEIINGYFELLKSCAILFAERERYKKICEEYSSVREKANEILKNTDSVCQDAELLIDKDSCQLKPLAQAILGDNFYLNKLAKKLCELFAEQKKFMEMGWTDDLSANIKVILAISKYEDKEKEIIANFGKEKGEKIICEQKKKVAKFEKTLGIYFFADDVLRFSQRAKITVLYSDKEQLNFTEDDNLDSQFIYLTNDFGDKLSFEKTGQFLHRGKIYLELILQENFKIRQLNYYHVEELEDSYRLTLEEDEKIFEELWAYQEQVEIRLSQKNRK